MSRGVKTIRIDFLMVKRKLLNSLDGKNQVEFENALMDFLESISIQICKLT